MFGHCDSAVIWRGETNVKPNFRTTQTRIYLFNFGYTALTPLHGCSRFLFSLFAVAIGRMRAPARYDLLPPQRSNTKPPGSEPAVEAEFWNARSGQTVALQLQ